MQQVLGTLLFYVRVVDPTLLVAINELSMQQAAQTAKTAEGITRLLNYCATYPDATVHFHASDMVLHVHSDVLYLTSPEGCSRAGGYFFLSTASKHPDKPPSNQAPSMSNA
eukprot:15358380-Ditylum_brightwellii.AAC.1